MNDLSVTVTADTEEFVESIEEATEAVDDLREALKKLDRAGFSVTLETHDKRDRVERAIAEMECDAR